VTPSQDSVSSQEARVAVLALIAGYIDSYAFLNYKVFASFMSGNTTLGGLQAGQASFAEAGHDLLPVPFFVVGVFLGTFLLHSSVRQQLPLLLALAAALLTLDMAAVCLRLVPTWVNIMTLSLAMGIMNTTISRVGGQSVSLGYVSGDLNNLGQRLALGVKDVPVSNARGSWDTHWWRAALLAGVWTAFLIGAALAGALTSRLADWTLLPPALVLLALASSSRATSAHA
jgi:uncharacterized membrane protein YoaK (UPF0700 family)